MYEPIAVVGIGCRFPGSSDDLRSFDSFSAFIDRGGDAVGDIPCDRWLADQIYSSDESSPGRAYVRRGAFLDWDFREFDAALFGISAKEAALMDPQQRLVMDVALECLHDAGADFDGLNGTSTGVFVGGFMMDHLGNTLHPDNRYFIDSHTATSSTMTMLSNRVSYSFGFRGPSLTVDTACSSSMVALHLACRALQARDADFCLTGGVNFMLRPETFIMLCKGHFLARDGRSKSFDASADGYGRGEGCGMIALKRLADARADDDDVLAVIVGSGVNQDGATSGITVPSAEAQASLMHKVYRESGITARDIAAFEAHGTGTPIGDPVETAAIVDVLREDGVDHPVALGSVKAGIGHQEAAAGIAGVLKAVRTVRAGRMGPQAWLQEVNPALPIDESPLEISTGSGRELCTPAGVAAVAINSFGYGGTNGHVVVAANA